MFKRLMLFLACLSVALDLHAGVMLNPRASHPYGQYFKDGVSVGNMDNSTNWQEQSGLSTPYSATNAAYLFTISDAPANQLQAINISNAANAGVITLTGATAMVDLEDIEGCKRDGVAYQYLMDFGNNGNTVNSRGSGIDMRIFRVQEPTITGSNFSTSSFIEINVAFPGVNGPTLRDAETTFVDPATCDIYVLPKRNASQQVYMLAFADTYSGTQTLVYQGALAFAVPSVTTQALGATACYTVDGAVSPDGKEVLAKTYDKVYRWRRDPQSQTIWQAIDTETPDEVTAYVGGGSVSPRKSHPMAEPQGEGLAFDYSGLDLYGNSEYLASEGSSATQYPFFKYERVANKAPTTYTFQQGVSPDGSYSGNTTTYIWGTNPATDRSGETSYVVDITVGNATDDRRGLIKMDYSTVPTTCKLISAKRWQWIAAEGQGWAAYRMLVPWDGTSTYNSLSGGVTNDGVEATAAASWRSGVNLDTIVNITERENMLLSDVQDMIKNPSTNYGHLYMNTDTATGDGVQFDSKSGATASRRPQDILQCQ